MANNTKVLIAGAGPVGLTLANELVRHGISVRIVDRSAARTDKSKALVLWSRTLELLDEAGYAEDFLSSGMPAHGAQISPSTSAGSWRSSSKARQSRPCSTATPRSVRPWATAC